MQSYDEFLRSKDQRVRSYGIEIDRDGLEFDVLELALASLRWRLFLGGDLLGQRRVRAAHHGRHPEARSGADRHHAQKQQHGPQRFADATAVGHRPSARSLPRNEPQPARTV